MNTKLKTFFVLAAMLLGTALDALADSPTVSNVRSAQRAGTQLVDIYYDLASVSNALTVSVMVSTNGGMDYTLPATSFIGAVGSGIAPGTNQNITWNAGQDWPGMFSTNVCFRVTADDQVAPFGMALIPAGTFAMGDSLGDSGSGSDELPIHTVYVSAFYMDTNLVSYALWLQVYQWATNHGYSFDYVGSGKATNHPVWEIDWYDEVKWCNARSEMAGMTPCYYTDATQTVVYRIGQNDLQASFANWNAGYRLPTEAEWEKAARGAASGYRFPWSDADTIKHSRANYNSSTNYAYDISPTRGFNPMFNDGVYPYTSPVGSFAANGYGLYDMAGNVWESCWDWYGSYSSGSQNDSRGPASGLYRVFRGGSWFEYAAGCRTANRNYGYPTYGSGDDFGFRSVLPHSGLPAITVQPQDKKISKGGSVTFSVTAIGDATLNYQWQKNGTDIVSATGASLTLTNVQSGGLYSVVISNGIGIITSRSAQLTVTSIGEG